MNIFLRGRGERGFTRYFAFTKVPSYVLFLLPFFFSYNHMCSFVIHLFTILWIVDMEGSMHSS